MKQLFGLICLTAILSGCSTSGVYEKMVFFPDHQWKSSTRYNFNFDITDTTALYNIFVLVRHEDAYHFNNLWLNVSTQAPGDSIRNQQVNIQLADNKKGWLGTGMDDVFDHRVRITRMPIKLKKGAYTFTLQQNMREEPLQYVLNAGIRVEKAQL